MRLRDKVAIITGAGRGIGRGCAEAFAREGAKVVVANRSVDAGEEVAHALTEVGGEASFVGVDVTVPEQAFWQPLGPISEISDVAEAAVFFASDESKFITGTVLPIDGGWTAQ